MEKNTKPHIHGVFFEKFGNTKGNMKPLTQLTPQSGGPKTPPPPKGSQVKGENFHY